MAVYARLPTDVARLDPAGDVCNIRHALPPRLPVLQDASMSRPALRRARNGQIAGVCSGVATYLGVSVDGVRVLTVLGVVFTSAPLLIAYLALAVLLPLEPDADAPPEGAVDWTSDSVRLTYDAPLVPHAFNWTKLLIGYAVGVVGALSLPNLALAVTVAVAWAAGVPVEGFLGPATALLGLVSGLLSVSPVLLAVGLLRRPFSVTCTHDAVWLERPFHAAVRVPLEQVEDLSIDGDVLRILLQTGEILHMPAPPESPERDAWMDEVLRSRRRALAHHEDLEAASDDRRELDRVLARRSEAGAQEL
ncbi:MAG: phage shock protein C [Myxococcota bacterium]|jgi:phage shock protein C